MYKPTTSVWRPTLPAFFKFTVLGTALISLGAMVGCSSTPTGKQGNSTQSVGYLSADDASLEDLLSATEMRAVEGDRLLILKHGDVWKRMRVGFKMDSQPNNARIAAQRAWFTSRQPYIDRLSARASRYLYHTVKEAERRGMPTELALLPIIESSYDPAATSSAAAAGLWQFIPSTGKIYGLKQNSLYDGRRDVVESTRAAYEFLGGLYNQFGSWELALAAYNAGPGRIEQAINRNKALGLPTDYWSLKLPEETMNYVPRFLAVVQIINNPQAYGVSLPPIANRPHFREITVAAGTSLNDISSITGLSRAELYALNPGHRGDRIDTESAKRILIPADLSPTIDQRLIQLSGTSSDALFAATNKPPLPSVESQVTLRPLQTEPPALITASATPKASAPVQTTITPTVKTNTPQGATALANFAANADIPSAPRIPVAVNTTSTVKPISTEPPITDAERQQILAALKIEENATQKVQDVLKPVATEAEQAAVIAELKQIAPEGTQIVDPQEGKIKLTALQTSLSVAENQGKEVTKNFSYPKSVAENTKSDSEEARLNSGKNYTKTDSEIIISAPKGKRSTYVVASGDTLATIAVKNGVNWRDVAKWNQIDPEATLYAGTVIYLYDAKPQVNNTPEKTPDRYVVQANDTLSGVATRFGLSLKQLAEYNDLALNDHIQVGQALVLKQSEKPKKAKVTPPVPEVKKIATVSYVVKRGDTLASLAKQAKMTTSELANLNQISIKRGLTVGQTIEIPEATFALVPTTHKVKSGETLSGVAAKYYLQVNYLAELNGLNRNDKIRAGQILKLSGDLPKKDKQPEKEVEKVTKKVATKNTQLYTVKSGESLYSIARREGMTIAELRELNQFSAKTELKIGQEILIPKLTTNYKVRRGDTLIGLASRYDLSVEDLAKLNNFKTNQQLKLGETILVPNKP